MEEQWPNESDARRGSRPSRSGRSCSRPRAKNTTDAEVCRRWGIAPHQLRVIRERAKESSLKGFSRGPGRPSTDPQIAELRAELERTTAAMHELAIENTLLRGKVNRV